MTVHLLHLPQLGYTMERGILTEWLVEDGVPYELGQPLYTVETDKNAIDIEAKLPGHIVRVVSRAGEEFPVGALLAVVADPGEAPSDQEIESAIAADLESLQVADGKAPDESGDGITPRDGFLGFSSEAGSELAGASPRRSGGRVRAIPKARAMAAKAGLALADVSGSGNDGTVTPADVEAHLSLRASRPVLAAATPTAEQHGVPVQGRRVVTGIARAMAESVTRSWSEVPQFVQTFEFDASGLAARRAAFKPAGRGVSYTDLVLHDVARAATAAPEANAAWTDGEVVLFDDVNIAVAMDSPRGLVIPVVRRVQVLGPEEVGSALRELVERASRRLHPDDTVGSTITVSNLGMQGVQTGVPLLNAPHSALVFVGSIADRPYVVDGALAVRPTCYVSIAYDHRVLDGATAARFTGALRDLLAAAPDES